MFLTLEDPRAKIQGSRDPLGVQPAWVLFGRQLVTNLTSVTTSVRGFSTVLLARYFTERLIQEGACDETLALPVFLRMEQIAAYARIQSGATAGAVLGVQRARAFLDEGARVTIDERDGAILSDQKVYGLWGLYSVSSRTSGLVADGPVGLSDEARRLVEVEYLPKLEGVESKLRRLLLRGGTLDTGKRSALFQALCDIFAPTFTPGETTFYSRFLRDARGVKVTGPSERQAHFVELLKKHADFDSWIGRDELTEMKKAATKKHPEIARALQRVLRLEALLAPAESVFNHLQARNNQKPAQVAVALREMWGDGVPNLEEPLEPLLSALADATSDELAQQMARCDRALATGDYEDAIETLLRWNSLVMERRKAAPWVRLTSGRLDVRYRGTEATLATAEELPTLWWNPYFIDSLKTITQQLEPVEVTK